jgi:serine/threonine-protein kinase
VLEDDPVEANGTRGQLVDAVTRSNFTLEFIAQGTTRARYATPEQLRRGDSFGFFLKPNNNAKRLYGLDREVLLWCSTYPTFQARDIESLRSVIGAHGTRLSRQFAILVTSYDPSVRSSLESEADLDLTLIHLSISQVKSRGIDALLAEKLYSRDLFDVTGATVRTADFFGRRELLDRIVAEIETGTSQTGLFGLRKVGKTSLLNRIADRLKISGKCSVARLDLQWTISINPAPEYTLWALGESIYASHRAVRAVRGFRLFGKFQTFSDLEDAAVVWEWFAHDLRLVFENSRRRVCILIDEVERMFEHPRERGFVRFWRLLRGLDQQHPGRLRIFIGGTSPQCVEVGLVESDDNPLFRYLRLEYLASLSRQDAGKLLNDLGAIMGLHFDNKAVDWIVNQSGGHPALLRTVGSTVHHHFRDRKDPVTVSEQALVDLAGEIMQRSSSVLDQMISALEDKYSDEFSMLLFLAQGKLHQYREYAALFPVEVQHLHDYGLVSGEATPGIDILLLQTHLVNRERARLARPESRSVLAKDEMIGPWRVLDCFSSGFYSDVYKVEALGSMAAAKVIRGGQLSALQREIDILKELRHPNIVLFKDSLRADDGSPTLIMELLGGRELAHFCSPSSRPAIAEWLDWLAKLLDALTFIHPKAGTVKALQAQESLSSAEFRAWDQARHGYVHRDIKPENVMITPDRGPVLIDFNIAVRSGSAVVTSSSTPGYLGGVGARWEPTVDLYALGVTFAEVGAGARIASSSISEVLEVAESNLGQDCCAILRSLLDAPESGLQAADARRFLSRVSGPALSLRGRTVCGAFGGDVLPLSKGRRLCRACQRPGRLARSLPGWLSIRPAAVRGTSGPLWSDMVVNLGTHGDPRPTAW